MCGIQLARPGPGFYRSRFIGYVDFRVKRMARLACQRFMLLRLPVSLVPGTGARAYRNIVWAIRVVLERYGGLWFND